MINCLKKILAVSLVVFIVLAGPVLMSNAAALYGDADADGEVTDWDCIVLERYLAGWNVDINLDVLDLDVDGTVSDWDSVILNRSMAGWDVSWAPGFPPEPTPEFTEGPTAWPTSEPTASPSPEPEPTKEPTSLTGEYETITIDTLSECRDYIQSRDLSGLIIDFSKIELLGDFERFLILSNAAAGEYFQYQYEMKDASGFVFHITITDLSVREMKKYSPELDPELLGSDLRTLSTSDKGYVMLNGIEYEYVAGRLLWISWEQNGYNYMITGNVFLDTYPDGYDTPLSKLLNKDTMLDEITVIKNSLADSESQGLHDDYATEPIYSLSECREYIQNKGISDKIIDYSKIESLGDFEEFLILSNVAANEYFQYWYVLKDASGFVFHITITDLSVREMEKNSPELDPELLGSDLRTLSTSDKGYVMLNGIEYGYVAGRLLRISWEQNGYHYKITGNVFLDTYPDGYDTPLSRLLNKDTMLDEINAIRSNLEN